MSAYALTPLAKADIFDIWTYLAENSEPTADRVDKRSITLAHFWPKARCAATPGPNSRRVHSVSGH